MSNSNYQAEVVSFEPAAAPRELDLAITQIGSSTGRVVWNTASAGRVVWNTASAGRVVWNTASAGRVIWNTASHGSARSRVSIAA
jgi:hypothetical protein